jgi:hypothetical protein
VQGSEICVEHLSNVVSRKIITIIGERKREREKTRTFTFVLEELVYYYCDIVIITQAVHRAERNK